MTNRAHGSARSSSRRTARIIAQRWSRAPRYPRSVPIAATALKYPIGDVPRPPHWIGYRIRPVEIEFWHDRPFRSTSSYRLGYPAWQRVYHAGFRVIVED